MDEKKVFLSIDPSVCKDFSVLTNEAHWKNFYQYSEFEQKQFLGQLCLDLATFIKTTDKRGINERCYYLSELEKLPDRFSHNIEISALASTALFLFYMGSSDNDVSTDKIKICEQQLHFTLTLLNCSREWNAIILINDLVAILKRAQGDYSSFVQISDYPLTYPSILNNFNKPKNESNSNHGTLNKLVISSFQAKTSHEIVAEKIAAIWRKLSINQQNKNLKSLLEKMKNPPIGTVHFSVSKIIGKLWPQFNKQQSAQSFFTLLGYLDHGQPYYDNDKSTVAEVLIKNIHLISESNRIILFSSSLSWLKTNPNTSLAIKLLIAMWPHLFDEQKEEIRKNVKLYFYDRLIDLYRNNIDIYQVRSSSNKNELFLKSLPLIWDSLLEPERQQIINGILYYNDIKNLLCYKDIVHLRNLDIFTATHKQKILETLVSIFNEGQGEGAELASAIWKLSEGKCNSIKLTRSVKNGLISKLIPTLTLTQVPKTLVQQLKEIGLLTIKALEKHILAKKVITYFCEQAFDLQTLRSLKDSLEQSRGDHELAYLVKRQKHNGFSLGFYQWQNSRNDINEFKTYHCSTRWIECMEIFKTRMIPYEKEFRDVDDLRLSSINSVKMTS